MIEKPYDFPILYELKRVTPLKSVFCRVNR